MRRIALILAVLIMLALIVGFYPTYVEKPVKDGSGPMAIRLAPELPAPQTHSPLDWWQTHHMDVVNQGHLTQDDCLYCHDPQTSCNNCHNYVGAKPITE
ncbi:MAG: hypothetical protein JSV81_18155 [Anaerolineales bacterium]|nr:MAG: hypothetical protein JSV81_18155 [Anaerolineales bacterium]